MADVPKDIALWNGLCAWQRMQQHAALMLHVISVFQTIQLPIIDIYFDRARRYCQVEVRGQLLILMAAQIIIETSGFECEIDGEGLDYYLRVKVP